MTGLFKISLLIVLVQVTSIVAAQKPALDFGKVNRAFQTEKFSVDISYQLYSNYQSRKPRDVMDGYYKKSGESFMSDLLGIKTVQNKNFRIVINSKDRLLLIADPIDLNPASLPLNIDTVLKYCSSVNYNQSADGTLKIYSLNFNQQLFEYSRIDFFIDSENYFLKKLVLYFKDPVAIDENNENSRKEKPRMEVVYSNLNTDTDFPDNLFSEKNYISVQNGKYIPTSEFNHYKVLNQKLTQ